MSSCRCVLSLVLLGTCERSSPNLFPYEGALAPFERLHEASSTSSDSSQPPVVSRRQRTLPVNMR